MEEISYEHNGIFEMDLSTGIYTDKTVFPHFHKNYELIIALSGSSTVSVGGKTYEINEGEAAFICPFQLHGFNVGSHSLARRVTYHENLILTIAQTLSSRIPQKPVFRVDDNILKNFTLFADGTFGTDVISVNRISPFQQRMRMKGFLYLIGADMLASSELVFPPTTDDIAVEIIKYIAENFRKNISLDEIAKEKGYATQYLSRLLNRSIKMNFRKCLNLCRIQRAYQLLQDTDLSVAQICFESGFQSIRSFNHVCREVYGITPKDLRRTRFTV